MGRIARMVERVTRGDSLQVMREATLRAETMMNYWKQRDAPQVMEFLRSRCVAIPDETNEERQELL